MKTASRLALYGVVVLVVIATFFAIQARGQSSQPPSSANGRYQIVAAPAASSVRGDVFLIDTASGRVWQYLLDPKCKNGTSLPGANVPGVSIDKRVQCFSEIDRLQ